MYAATVIVFWSLWLAFHMLSRRKWLSKKDKACFAMVIDFFGFLMQLLSPENLILKTAMMLIWALVFAVDYWIWKNSDDDDGPKKRRRAWVKNKLPKPVTKAIPVPL